MPIDEGIETDLKFLVLEVSKQLEAVQKILKEPNETKLKRVANRDDYVDQMKDMIETKSNTYIYGGHRRQSNYFQSLITVSANLERMADFLVQVAKQTEYIVEFEVFSEFDLSEFFDEIKKGLDLIHETFVEVNVEKSKQICDIEQRLDDLYLEMFQEIMLNLRDGYHVEDMITVLFIIRYLERIGDAFLNIGESIINVTIGEKMRLRSFKTLEKGLRELDIDITSDKFEYKPILNTRSGCKIARLIYDRYEHKREVFYKEGQIEKVYEEIKGFKLFDKHCPGYVPKLLWQARRTEHLTVLYEWIAGRDMLDICIHKSGGTKVTPNKAIKLLIKQLERIWSDTKKTNLKGIGPNYIDQLLQRKDDIALVHKKFFKKASKAEFSSLLQKTQRIESRLPTPFLVLTHGDFNVDNVVFDIHQPRPYFVDLHRAKFMDYTQDVSVFLVSNFRVPVFSDEVRKRLNRNSSEMFQFAKEFAKEHKDKTFEARLALGLFRSFATSTRFQFDVQFSDLMFTRGLELARSLVKHKGKLENYQLDEEIFLY